jgi:hypothetical protein
MDSYPAIRNFINGGGSKEDLNQLVREWWIWCKLNRVTPLYKWIPRESNTLADELSKRAAQTLQLRPEAEQRIRQWLDDIGQHGLHENQWIQTRVQCPVFDHIAVRIQEMRRSRHPACIVVPVWPGQAWRPDLVGISTDRLKLGHWNEVLTHRPSSQANFAWHMEAHLLVPQ